MISILIVEDDLHISKMIGEILKLGGYIGEICDNGEQAANKILHSNYDLVLLDVLLPNMNEFEVMEKIANKQVPIIFLTAMHDVTDKVKGLKLGAEDYMVKPFEAVELLARIEVVLRRTHHEETILKFQDITLNLEEHLVSKNGKPVNLTPKEFDLLVFFLQNPKIALTREKILASVWDYGFEGETRTVDSHIQQLRKKLGLHKQLKSIPKLGYRLESGDELAELSENMNMMANTIRTNFNALEHNVENRKLFIDNLAHEMKVSLTSILDRADSLRIKHYITEEERQQYAGEIVEETKKLRALSVKLMELITVSNPN